MQTPLPRSSKLPLTTPQLLFETAVIVELGVAKIRLWLKLLLQKQGYEVVEADGGLKARTLLGKQNFDMIITDLLMPEFIGIELIKEAKS